MMAEMSAQKTSSQTDNTATCPGIFFLNSSVVKENFPDFKVSMCVFDRRMYLCDKDKWGLDEMSCTQPSNIDQYNDLSDKKNECMSINS